MKDLPIHLVLFGVVGLAITVLNSIFAESEDSNALRGLPKRLLWFFLGSGAFAVILLLVERFLAATS
jgi:hypothetical protein